MIKRMRAIAGTLIAYGFLSALLFTPLLVEAGITRIEIATVESPTFGGTSFGDAGQYEKLRGRAFGEVDPNDHLSKKITDIEFAPVNANGMVEYSTDVVILRPIDAAKGNARLFYELSNRGTILALRVVNSGAAPAAGRTDYPSTATDAGNGFLMREGYTILFSGWDLTAVNVNGSLLTNVPIASFKNPDGTTSPIVGPAVEEFFFDNTTTRVATLTYPSASLDKSKVTLTVRTHYEDPQTAIPASDWEFVSATQFRLLPLSGTPPVGKAFDAGRLYEFKYEATNPRVAGLSHAMVRDLALFFREGAVDSTGKALTGDIDFIYGHATSQPGRLLRDFVDLGFNRADDTEHHHFFCRHHHDDMVFDGILNWIAGGSGGFFNHRFAIPNRTHRQHIGRWTPERLFPFAWQLLFDPVTRQFDGRIVRCALTGTCPKILEANSANEYWVKGGSLLHTDTRGHDLFFDAPHVRLYHFSGRPHSSVPPGADPTNICQQPRNTLAPGFGMRSLLVALDEWVSKHRPPPHSDLPRRFDGTLVRSPQDKVGFPSIPGVKYNGLMSTGDLFDFGPQFKNGILDFTTVGDPAVIKSPVVNANAYPVFVPKTDKDGNEIAGVRFPEVEVPTATYTGWALRKPELAGDDLCDAFGQELAFKKTKAERDAAGDPRLSLQERYPTHADYVQEVTKAAQKLQKRRLLLQEDVDRYIQAAEASSVGN
jgi:hypothetical protein